MVQAAPSTTHPFTGVTTVAGAVTATGAIMFSVISGLGLITFCFGRRGATVDEMRFTARDLAFFTRRHHLGEYLHAGVGVGAPRMPPDRRWRRFPRRWRRSAPIVWRSRSCASARLRGAAATAAAGVLRPRVRCGPGWRPPAWPGHSPFP